MNTDAARLLPAAAEECAKAFSSTERMKNYNKETFLVAKIEPLSGKTAAVYLKKNTGKLALFFFYFRGDGRWCYFCPDYDHVYGMEEFGKLLRGIEKFNFPLNYESVVVKA